MKKASSLLAASLTRLSSRLRSFVKSSPVRLLGLGLTLCAVLGVSLFLTTFLIPRDSYAAACSSNNTGGGNWNSGATWSGCSGTGGVPGAADIVTIRGGDTVNVDTVTAVCASLTVNNGDDNLTGTVNFISGGTGQLTVGGNVTLGGGGTRVGVLTMANGGALKIGGTFTVTSNGSFTAGTGTVDFNGTGGQTVPVLSYNNLIVSGARTSNNVTLASGTINVAGNYNASAIFTSGSYAVSGNTVTLNASSGTQTISGTPTFNNLTLSNTGVAFDFSTSTTTIAATLTANNGSMTAGTSKVILTGTGNLAGGSNKNFYDLQINSGATITHTSGNMTIAHDFTNNGTLNFSGTRTATFNGGVTQSLSGSGSTIFNNLTISSSSTVNAGSHNITVAGTSLDFNTGSTFNGGPSTATFSNAGTLTIGGGGTYNFGSVTINNGTNLANPSNRNLSVSGSWTNNGSYSQGTETITFNGSSPQIIGGTTSTTFQNLKINGTSTVTLNTNATVPGLLTLNSDLTTGAAIVLTMPNTGTSSGTADVVGNVKRTGAFGLTSYSYGNPNTTITFTTPGTSPSDITVKLDKVRPADFNNAIERTYTVNPNGGSAYVATLRLHYRADNLVDDLNGNTETSLTLWRKDGGTWNNQSKTAQNTTDPNNWTETSGVTTFSPWTLAAAAPTAVKLRSFTATQNSNNEVTLNWRTGHEVRNLGYYVYREQNGQRTRITPSIVAGSALIAGRNTVMRAGMSYTWYDQLPPDQSGSATYWLEDVDLDGTRTLHGPIAPARSYDLPGAATVTYGSGVAPSTTGQTPQGRQTRSELLSEVQKHGPASGSYFREWPTVFASQQAALVKAPQPGSNRKAGPDAAQAQAQATQETIGGMSGIKIAVSRSGWQRITQPELVAAGLDPNVSAQKLQLYDNGSPVPIRLSGNRISLTAADHLEFYGHGLESPTDLDQTYYLVVGKETGSRIIDVKKAPTLLPPSGPSSFDYTVERKDKYLYYAALLNGDKENIFGHIVTSSPVDETVPVSNRDPAAAAAGAQAHLDVSLVGVSLEGHHVRVSVNGTDVGTIDFDGAENPVRTFALPAGLLVDGDNTVRFASVSTDRDVSLVETVRLTYPHSFKADNNSLAIGVNSSAPTRVSGFTSANIRVVDITNQSNMSELTQTINVKPQPDGTFAADIQVPTAMLGSPHTLLLFAGGQALHPDLVRRNDPSSWAMEKAGFDYLIITSRDLKTNVEPLAQLRRIQGLTVGVVDVEDLYDEFSFGLHSPQAIHDFLQSAVNNWKRTPRYVLLAGDASYDPKNYLGQGSTDFVPTKLFDSALMETASDDWLADFDGDGIADIAIGRLPLRTTADADLMVNKIVSYEAMAPDPTRNVVLVADYSFERASSALQSLVPAAVPVQVINRSSSDDGTIHTQIVNGINQGPRLVNYVGHGSIGVWTGAPVLSNDDAPSLTNTNRLSVFVTMTCLNGYFQNAYDDSLSEALLRTQGGAVAVWASTGLTDPPGQDLIDQELYRQLFGGTQPTLGDAVLNAKHATADSDVRRTWILFGDPAMKLR